MRKASKIIYLVAAIISIVVAVNLLISGIVLVAIPNSDAFKEAFVEAWAKNTNPDIKITMEQAFEATKAGMIAGGVVCLVLTCTCAVNSVFAFKAFGVSKRGKPSNALNILNIVFGALSIDVNIVAAIFAFIANGQEERRETLKEKE